MPIGCLIVLTLMGLRRGGRFSMSSSIDCASYGKKQRPSGIQSHPDFAVKVQLPEENTISPQANDCESKDAVAQDPRPSRDIRLEIWTHNVRARVPRRTIVRKRRPLALVAQGLDHINSAAFLTRLIGGGGLRPCYRH